MLDEDVAETATILGKTESHRSRSEGWNDFREVGRLRAVKSLDGNGYQEGMSLSHEECSVFTTQRVESNGRTVH